MTQMEFEVVPDLSQLSDEERSVAAYLEDYRGEYNAVSAAHLSDLTGIADRRLRALIKNLVEKHSLCICSSPRGFYVPADAAEVLDAAHRLLSWGFSAMKRARALRRTPELHRLCGQMELELARVQREMEAADADSP